MTTIFEVVHGPDFLRLPADVAAAQIRAALPGERDDERLRHLGRLILIEQARRRELDLLAFMRGR